MFSQHKKDFRADPSRDKFPMLLASMRDCCENPFCLQHFRKAAKRLERKARPAVAHTLFFTASCCMPKAVNHPQLWCCYRHFKLIQQIWSALLCTFERLFVSPFFDLGLMSAQQDIGHPMPAPFGRTGIDRRIQQVALKTVR